MKLKDFRRERLTLKLPVRADTMYSPSEQVIIPSMSITIRNFIFRDVKNIFCKIDPKSVPGFAFSKKSARILCSLVGKAKCHANDKFDEQLGYKLAHARLLSLIYGFFGNLITDQLNKLVAAKIALNDRFDRLAVHRAVLSASARPAAKKPAAKKPAAKKPAAKKPAAKKLLRKILLLKAAAKKPAAKKPAAKKPAAKKRK